MAEIVGAHLVPIFHNVVANALSPLLARLLPGHARTSTVESADSMLRRDGQLQTIIGRAIAAVGKRLELRDASQTASVQIFLGSAEVDEIARQLYASKISSGTSRTDGIRTQFKDIFALYLPGNLELVDQIAGDLFDGVASACDRALEVATERGVLMAHDARSAARFRMLSDQLAAIEKRLAFMAASPGISLETLTRFETQYREQVVQRHGYITPPHFDVARRVPIGDLYVSPNFRMPSSESDVREAAFAVGEILSTAHRIVVLGSPGAGKSTFAQKLCHDLGRHYDDRMYGRRRVVPFLVVLRDFGSQKKDRAISIVDFIGETVNSRYQLRIETRLLEYMLLNGRAVVIFDGLDELLDTSFRQEIRSDIESFCNLYPAVPIVVTSRRVGYEQAPLDPQRFEIFGLSDFDESQVRAYAEKWFLLDPDLGVAEARDKAAAFLRESGVVSDLRGNALMLALMCNLYRGENYIPRNRPDVYEKCALMLFERWDKQRGIFVPLPFEAHVRPAMMHLAHWLYREKSLEGGVTESELIAEAAAYLKEWAYEEEDAARGAAREFIEFCRGRAWVFTDTGTTGSGERLYQFTHRTFLEYFTACYLVRKNPTPESLAERLRPRVASREWDVVAQLACQVQQKQTEGAADVLLADMVEQVPRRRGAAAWNFLSFAARALEFLIPRPRTTRAVAEACLGRCLDRSPDRASSRAVFQTNEVGEIMAGLLRSAPENRHVVLDVVDECLKGAIRGDEEPRARNAAALLQELPFMAFSRGPRDGEDPWNALCERIRGELTDELEAQWRRCVNLAAGALLNGYVSAEKVVQWFGAEGLFHPKTSTTLGLVIPSFATRLLGALLGDRDGVASARDDLARDLGVVGRNLTDAQLPWVRIDPELRWTYALHPSWIADKAAGARPGLALVGDALFGAFAIVGVAAEAIEQERADESGVVDRGAIRRLQRRVLIPVLRKLLVARYSPSESAEFEVHPALGLTRRQSDVVSAWAQRQLGLIHSLSVRPRRRRRSVQ
jgi:hypothetical protein